MSSNGLFPSTSVCSTGEPASSYYVRKGDVIPSLVVQPQLTVLSASGLQSATLSINNAGLTQLVAAGAVEIESAGNGTGIYEYSDGGSYITPYSATSNATLNLLNGPSATTPSRITFFNTSLTGGGNTSGDLGVYGYTGAGLGTVRRLYGSTAIGSVFDVGDATTVGGAVLNVNGPSGAGRVFDTVYNPVTTINSLANGTGNIIVFSSGERPAGKYQVQLYATDVVPNAGTLLNLFAQDGSSATIPFSATSLRDTEVESGISDIVLSSGIFSWNGSGTITIQALASAGNWTSSDWSAQIIKIA